jgi:hypothetical protein
MSVQLLVIRRVYTGQESDAYTLGNSDSEQDPYGAVPRLSRHHVLAQSPRGRTWVT